MAQFGSAARLCGAIGRAEARLLRLFRSFAIEPRSLAVPLAYRRAAPDRLAADSAVGARHLVACDVGADSGGRDVEEGSHVAGSPPVGRKRLSHTAQSTALTLPDPGSRPAAR